MDMSKEEVVLCGASAYSKKYYLNEDFRGLPESVRDELKIMCVLFTEDIGGIFQLVFDEEGNLSMDSSETDAKKEESLERNVSTGRIEEREDLEDEE